MTKKAMITTKNGAMTPNGRERIMELRAGAKGTGKVLFQVIYWPWSDKSCEQADEIVFQAARMARVEVVENWE